MRRETRDRVILPVLIPVAAVVGTAFAVFFFSRILLAVEPLYATLIALGLAVNVLTAAALVAALPRLRSAIIVGALGLAALLLAGGGVLAMVVSPEARVTAEAAGEEGPGPGGGPGPGEEEPGGGGNGGGAACQPDGTELSITAPPGGLTDGFDTTCLAAPAGEAATVEFVNDDAVVHNWALYRDESAQEHLGGGTVQEPIQAGQATTYQLDPLEPGSYFFRCDFHPVTMTGTFVVE